MYVDDDDDDEDEGGEEENSEADGDGGDDDNDHDDDHENSDKNVQFNSVYIFAKLKFKLSFLSAVQVFISFSSYFNKSIKYLFI